MSDFRKNHADFGPSETSLWNRCPVRCTHKGFTWENTLMSIVETLDTKAFKKRFDQISDHADQVEACWRDNNVRRRITNFIKDFAELPTRCAWHRKDSNFSDFYRSVIAKRYRENELTTEEYSNYNYAVARALIGTKELSLAHGNRSALLFDGEHYEAALGEIQRALDANYAQFMPQPKVTNLLKRKVLCLARLKRFSEAERLLHDEVALAEVATELQPELQRLIDLDLPAPTPPPKSTDEQFELKIQEMRQAGRFVPHETLTFLSSKLELNHDPETGSYYVVAKEDLQFGEPLAIMKPSVSVLLNTAELDQCHHCLQPFYYEKASVPLPCTQCAKVLFCSDRCRTTAWDSYHRFECAHLAILHDVSPKFLGHLTLRLLYSAGLETVCQALRTPDFLQTGDLSNQSDYQFICQLARNDNKSTIEKIHYAVTACMLTQLVQSSKFLGDNFEFPQKRLGGHILQHLYRVHSANTQAIWSGGEDGMGNPAALLVKSFTNMFFRHSCAPNASQAHIGTFTNPNNFTKTVLRATRPIAAGEEVTITVTGVHYTKHNWETRQKKHVCVFSRLCKCDRCSIETRDNLELEDPFYHVACTKCGDLVDKSSGSFRCVSEKCQAAYTAQEMKLRFRILTEYFKLLSDMLKKPKELDEKALELLLTCDPDSPTEGPAPDFWTSWIFRNRAHLPRRLLHRKSAYLLADQYDRFSRLLLKKENYVKAFEMAEKSLALVESCFGLYSQEMYYQLQVMNSWYERAAQMIGRIGYSGDRADEIKQRYEELRQMYRE